MIPETSPDARYNHLPLALRHEMTEAAKRHTVTVRALLGPSGRRNIVAARTEVMRWLRARGYSYPQIGRIFGKHHTSVMYCLNGKPEPKKEPVPFPDYSGEWAI